MDYFKTTTLTHDEEIDSCKKAARQKDEVKRIMKHGNAMTASEVWIEYDATRCPLTSIRRAMTVLCYDGHLAQLEATKIGLYVYKWF